MPRPKHRICEICEKPYYGRTLCKLCHEKTDTYMWKIKTYKKEI